MPLKLNVGASRKVTDNNYGSRGASVNLEFELDASLVAEPDKLQAEIRRLFGLVRASVAEELNGHGKAGGNGAADTQTANLRAPHFDGGVTTSSRAGTNGTGSRPATASQVRALHAIARSQGIELSRFLYDCFQLHRANDLTIKLASTAIDALKAVGVGSGG
jgi:hypothetical protein